MKIFAKKRSNSAAFQLNPVAAGCAVFLSMLAGSVYAQEAAAVDAPKAVDAKATGDAPVQAVVVSGIRRGIEAAISIKKNSSSIVEAISSEDIGKLPDSSVAESIARLPGVTAQRSRASGKAAEVSVRGLAPSFNGSLLNGREQASTGNARSPEFDLFPAELIGSAMIYKTPDATVIGQGLAATIDLRTVQPLDFAKRVLAVGARTERSGVGSGSPTGDGSRYTFSYVDQFANRTVGVAIGLTSFKETGGGQQKFEGAGTGTVKFNGADVLTPSGFKADTETSTDKRDGVSATLQFRPNKEFKTSLDMFYSAGKASLKKTGLEGSVNGSWGMYDPAGQLLSANVNGGVATDGTMSGYKGVVRNHMERAEDKLTSLGWNGTWKKDDWTAIADLSHSKAVKHSSRYETTAGQPGNTPVDQLGTISWTGFDGKDVSKVKFTPSFNYADRSKTLLNDVDGWGGGPNTPQAGYVALPDVDDKVDAIRLSGRREMELGPIVATSFGVNYTKRNKVRTGSEGRLVVNGPGGGYATAVMPGSETGIAGTTGIPVVSWDPTGSIGSVYSLARWVDATVLAKDWSVSEKVSTAYAMSELEGTLAGFGYRGNVGAQFVHTSQSTTGNKVDLATCTGITVETCPSSTLQDGTSYNDFLPSANVSFDLGNDQALRFGLAKVLARSNLDDMRASSAFGVSNTHGDPILVGTGGNAKLEPFRAKALDVSYEKYFGKKAYFSAAAFYKKLDTYILRAPRIYDFASQVSATTPLPSSGANKGSTIGMLTVPTNGDGGNIHGYELSVSLPLSLLTPVLDGFGVDFNYSNTSSGIEMPSAGFGTLNVAPTKIPLPGLSKQVSNLRLYYEKSGFQIGWTVRKRSDFLGQIADFQDNSQLTFVKGETIMDVKASYEFQKGMLQGFSVYLQANNWNKTPYVEFNGVDSDAVTYKTNGGRLYQFGANYKF
ncbi:TonB-dependent receptor [Oxalobacteraceae bacterium]|nr:TonB-dependent receptor [Oxalobacteraceae bacterium]